jgi:hypothetical protein
VIEMHTNVTQPLNDCEPSVVDVLPEYGHSSPKDVWSDLSSLAASLNGGGHRMAAIDPEDGVERLEARLVSYAASARVRHPSRLRTGRW